MSPVSVVCHTHQTLRAPRHWKPPRTRPPRALPPGGRRTAAQPPPPAEQHEPRGDAPPAGARPTAAATRRSHTNGTYLALCSSPQPRVTGANHLPADNETAIESANHPPEQQAPPPSKKNHPEEPCNPGTDTCISQAHPLPTLVRQAAQGSYTAETVPKTTRRRARHPTTPEEERHLHIPRVNPAMTPNAPQKPIAPTRLTTPPQCNCALHVGPAINRGAELPPDGPKFMNPPSTL
ncbi:serine/arginine repetitive matrix protein 1-like isoform X2 [Gouania willdenowi]|uniref:serine/arginine repetitive matrix protein 1-like isoform X2 n=1 Tax=Gouania willdenowi TaxID=441366 RepID=UPI001056C648|nr:serine/arginine repetitive matrix protein 1-like isoform X2 [Gouania willdenowi]